MRLRIRDGIALKYARQFTEDWMKAPFLDDPWPHGACARDLWIIALERYFQRALDERAATSKMQEGTPLANERPPA